MLYFEDFSVGQVFQLGPYRVTEEEMLNFANAFDPQYFHVDKQAAENSPFGGLIASGWHTAAIFMRMQCDSFLADSACIASPGVENIRWLLPVRAEDTLTGSNEVIGKRALDSKPDRGLIKCAVEIKNQESLTVMRLSTKAFFKKRHV